MTISPSSRFKSSCVLLFSLVLLTLPVQRTYAQLTTSADTTICRGGTANLRASTLFGVTLTGLQTVNLNDDQYSQSIPIGFPFEFYGQVKNNLIISSNNYISFNTANANGFSPWTINAALPDPGSPLDAIMCPWQDINPGVGGTIEYGTVGTAPNRIFVVRFLSIPMFSCTNISFCSGIYLFEGSNRIETHLENKPLCPGWNGGAAVHGLHNATGTVADIVPGRNFPLQWTAMLDGIEFVPNAAGTAYTINTIPFNVPPSDATTTWHSMSGALLATGLEYNVSPNNTTDYEARVEDCFGNIIRDTVRVNVLVPVSPNVTVIDETCGGTADGSIIITPQGNISPWDFEVIQTSGPSAPDSLGTFNQTTNTETYDSLTAASYLILVTDSNSCPWDSVVNVNAPDSVKVEAVMDTTICIGGTATLSATGSDGAGGPYSFVWNQGLVGNGPFNVNPTMIDTFTVYAIDVNGCESEPDSVVVTFMPPIDVSVSGIDTICPGDQTILTANATGGDGTANYTWSDGMGSLIPGQMITVDPAANTQYCVTATDGCETPAQSACVDVVVRILPDILITPDVTEGCFPVEVNFTNNTVASEVGDVVWNFGDGTPFATDSFATNHTYADTGIFDVGITITSPFGCTHDSIYSMLIASRDYPVANFSWSPEVTTIFDTDIDFTNLSTDNVLNSWDFAGLESSTLTNPSYEFTNTRPGNYPVTLEVTNIYGCTDLITQTVVIQDEFLLFAPNAFSPNGDGLNDLFFVVGDNIDLSNFELLVFDRWGNQVYQSKSLFDGWDGKNLNGQDLPLGTYVWKIKTKSATQGEPFESIGSVTIVK